VGGGAKEFHSPPATRSNEETLPKLTVINKYVGQISPNSSMKRSLNCFVVFIFCIASYDHGPEQNGYISIRYELKDLIVSRFQIGAGYVAKIRNQSSRKPSPHSEVFEPD